MKMIMAIVNNDDSATVANHLTDEGYSATKLATTGGFLKAGNTTFLIGVEDDQVDDVIALISEFSQRRAQIIPASPSFSPGVFSSAPLEVHVGGATVFVMDVERFEKC